MQIGSQHVSYHAGQRTFIMLHAGPQTEVKEEFLHLAITMELRVLQSCRCLSLPPNNPPATILSTVHFNGFFCQLQGRSVVEFIEE